MQASDHNEVLFDRQAKRLLSSASLMADASRLRFVRGERVTQFARLGVNKVIDELLNMPYRYIDLTNVTSIAQAQVGEEVTVIAYVGKVNLKRPRPKMSIVEVYVWDQTETLVISYFGQPWLTKQFTVGQRVAFSGKISFSYGYKRMNGAFHDVLDDADQINLAEKTTPEIRLPYLPVHHTTEGLSAQWARRVASCAIEDYADVCDIWPARLRAKRRLMPLRSAFRYLHFPQSLDELEQARKRLAYDETALLQTALFVRKDVELAKLNPQAHAVEGNYVDALYDAMPFKLTGDQAQAVAEIFDDMKKPVPMNRLVLGDVGTGKTAVATFALAAVANTGTQAAVMAPTSVLATQYAQKIGPILDACGISWALLTGATPASQRKLLLPKLAEGEITVLFGTHALLSDNVLFKRLTLVVIDEQQRFGVNQRHLLREKGRGADLLVMTATPIPRTLALALYGDLDLSYLRERPVQGAGIDTYVIEKDDRGQAYDAIKEQLALGHQAYIICPLVGTKPDDSQEEQNDVASQKLASGEDPSDAKAAQQEAEILSRTVFRDARVGLLTGRMKAEEKTSIMSSFKAGEIDVLVSTTVVEVGVDVPNATIMLIEDGERFGLAQLHQLCGRVGRGSARGSVYIAANTSNEVAKERLQALEKTSDGFKLAEEDLKLRREGTILGLRQSGETTLKFLDVSEDEAIIIAAREDVREMLKIDPHLDSACYAPIKDRIIALYGDVFREVGGG